MTDMKQKIETYCIDKSTKLSSVCHDIQKFTIENEEHPQMLSGELQGSLLGFLVSLTQAKHVLEIGSFTGFSALAMAERLPQDGTLITLDINYKTNQMARKFWDQSPHGFKIKSILGDAIQTLSTFKQKFDLIFIDADKPNYQMYFQFATDLITDHGLIIIDNCLWDGKVLLEEPDSISTRTIQDLNNYLKHNFDFESVLLPIRDGLFLIKKRLN